MSSRSAEPVGPASAPVHEPGAHIPALDGLRGIAVLTVMLLHFSMLVPHSAVERVYANVVNAGWAGVDLFFVLSGFLITGILYDAKGTRFYFRRFYMRRTLRIFPLYYAFLFALFFLLPVLLPSHDEAGLGSTRLMLWSYLGNVAFAAHGWEGMPAHTTHLWSLAVEEQFYLLWPLVVWLADRRQLVRVCLATIIAATLTRLGLHLVASDGIAGYALLPARMDALAIGGLIAVLVRLRDAVDFDLVLWARPAALLATSVLALVVLVRWAEGGTPTLSALDFRVQMIGYPAFALLFGALVVEAVHAPVTSRLHSLLTTRTLLALGKYSYALYLVHIPLRDLLRNRVLSPAGLPRVLGSQMPAQVALIVGGVAVSYAVAFISWHAFEKRLLALKRHFPYEKAERGAGHTRAEAEPVTVSYAGASASSMQSRMRETSRSEPTRSASRSASA